MLTVAGWKKVSEAEARARGAWPAIRQACAAVRRPAGARRWRLAAQEIIEIVEVSIASAAVVGVLAGATLLLIRALAV